MVNKINQNHSKLALSNDNNAACFITREKISDIFKKFWKNGYGSIETDEALFIQQLIAEHSPSHFLEIGMASGISGGLISLFLDRLGGTKFTTIDHDNTFFGDNLKENGFLIDKIYTSKKINVKKRPFTTALDLDKVGETYDMAFIDANHQHPWPIIDTICLFPHLTGDKIVIHHDLRLFRNQNIVFGIGPKYLWDQFPDNHKRKSAANKGNIFMVDLNISKDQLEEIAADAFSLPWSLRDPLQNIIIEKIIEMLKRHYSDYLLNVFKQAVSKFNGFTR